MDGYPDSDHTMLLLKHLTFTDGDGICVVPRRPVDSTSPLPLQCLLTRRHGARAELLNDVVSGVVAGLGSDDNHNTLWQARLLRFAAEAGCAVPVATLLSVIASEGTVDAAVVEELLWAAVHGVNSGVALEQVPRLLALLRATDHPALSLLDGVANTSAGDVEAGDGGCDSGGAGAGSGDGCDSPLPVVSLRPRRRVERHRVEVTAQQHISRATFSAKQSEETDVDMAAVVARF